MKKIFLLVVLTVIVLPLTVFAATEEELNARLDSLYEGDEIELNMISPINIADTSKREIYMNFISVYLSHINSDTIKISDDYNGLYIERMTGPETSIKSKTKTIVWKNVDENGLNKILNFVDANKRKVVNDIEFLIAYTKYDFYNNNEAVKDYLNDIKTDSNIDFDVFVIPGGGSGSGETFVMLNGFSYGEGIKTIVFKYNDIIYYGIVPEIVYERDEGLGLYNYPVLYIPSDTEENTVSYIESASQIIKQYFIDSNVVNYPVDAELEDLYNTMQQFDPNVSITDSEKENYAALKRAHRRSRLNYGYENGYIDRGLNESFEPVVAKVTIGNQSFELMIAKGTDNQKSNQLPVSIKNEYKTQAIGDTNSAQGSESNSTGQTGNNESSDNSKTPNSTSGTVENPKTGNSAVSLLIVFGIMGLPGVLYVLKNKNKFSKI